MDWGRFLDDTDAELKALRALTPDTAKGFGELARAAKADGALDAKTKELIALAIGIAVKCDGCLGYHARALVRLGATRQEIAEMAAVSVYMGGGPSLMYAARALAAFDSESAAGG
jgi:AhpD family alkylhydroperoxidase